MEGAGAYWGENGGWIWESGPGMMKSAIPEAAAALAGVETEWDTEKLEQKLRGYFNKAGKNMEFKGGKTLEVAIQEYADNVMGTLFAGMGDREWFTTGQADLLGCLDASIKDIFPSKILKWTNQAEFEALCLQAYERAFDEQRFGPILSEAVPALVTGPKIKKKVWTAFDDSRRTAVQSGVGSIEEFLNLWVNGCVAHLSESNWGSPEGTIEASLLSQLFVSIIEAGGLPMSLTQDGQEIPLQAVDSSIQAAYTEHTYPDGFPGGGPPTKKKKGGWAEEDEGYGAWGGAGKGGPYGKGGGGGWGGPYGKGGVTPPGGKGGGKFGGVTPPAFGGGGGLAWNPKWG